MKALVVYDSKYGNTKLAAESILAGIKKAGEIEADISYAKEVEIRKAADYDVLVLGAPNHMGRPSRTMKRFIDGLTEQDLKAKNVAVFGTYSGNARNDRAVKKLEKMVEKKLPKAHLILPGLSVRVKGIPGPIVDGELSRCVDFGREIGSQLKNL